MSFSLCSRKDGGCYKGISPPVLKAQRLTVTLMNVAMIEMPGVGAGVLGACEFHELTVEFLDLPHSSRRLRTRSWWDRRTGGNSR